MDVGLYTKNITLFTYGNRGALKQIPSESTHGKRLAGVQLTSLHSTHYRHTKHMLPHNHVGLIMLFKYFNSFQYQQLRQGNK